MNGKEFIKAVKNITAEKGISEDIVFDAIDDTGHVSAIAVQRIYYIHIVMQLRHIDRVELRHFRVGFNRNGIVRVEEASLG